MVRFGVVGLGFMGRTHLATLARLAGAEIAAVHDVLPERLAGPLGPGGGNIDTGGRAWDASSVRRCASLEELLEAGVDAVVVAVPSDLHAELSCAALSAGKHVFCEKPMALTLADCDRMLAAAESAGRVLMIGHCIRFWGEYAAAAELVRSGRFGRLRSLLLSRSGGLPRFGAGDWFLDPARSGGAVMDLHIHDVDYALFLLGQPRSIRATGTIGATGGVEQVAALYDYGPDGPAVMLEGGWLPGAGVPFVMSFRLCLDGATMTYSSDGEPPARLYGPDGAIDEPIPRVSGHEAEMEHFVECVDRGAPSPIAPAESARRSVAAALGELDSIRSGSPVEMP